MNPTEFAYNSGLTYSKKTLSSHKKSNGQFFTPIKIADFMASISSQEFDADVRVCDPGCGPGILTCSLVKRLIEKGVRKIEIDLFETDLGLKETLNKNLDYLVKYCKQRDVRIEYTIHYDNFLIYVASNLKEMTESYDVVISNPPYFKLRKDDINIKAVGYYVNGITNIYSGFIAASIQICKISGECIFIVPRSFTAGLYFKTIREFIFKETRIKRVHLFHSRTKTFKEDKVLQETVVFKTSNNEGTKTEISVSDGLSDLGTTKVFEYQITDLVDLESEDKVLHLPKDYEDFAIIEKIRNLKFKLSDHQIKVSTGRVVAFRAKSFINTSNSDQNVPLLWGDNIKNEKVIWPLKNTKRPQYISENASNLLVPLNNYVIQRRFSAKEDQKRLVCAPLLKSNFNTDLVGLENKTNFFYRINSDFTDDHVIGLSALLNSSIYDSYFRMINGNINVSATEMRLLPMPSLEKIELIGTSILKNDINSDQIENLIEKIIFETEKNFAVA